MRSTFLDMANHVMNFAIANYERDGWDYVVECLTIDDIAKDLESLGITSEASARAVYFRQCQLWEDQCLRMATSVF